MSSYIAKAQDLKKAQGELLINLRQEEKCLARDTF